VMAYDFVYLYDKFKCELQIGGSDQWGNITAGIDLARRMRGAQLQGLTSPLLTKSDGTKMGKTESGTVWLSPKRTSPYQFYQYWIRTEDADVGKVLRMMTTLPHEEIESLDASREQDAAKRDSQRRLAEELTRLVHGDDGLKQAQQATSALFTEPGKFEWKGDDAELLISLSKDLLVENNGFPAIDAFVVSQLAKSKSEARRLIEQGGAYVNGGRIESVDARLTTSDLTTETDMVLRAGKKNYALLRFE
jgi:tyrosyl-tRNA synthetase